MSGQMLIEVVVAIAVIALVLVGVSSLMTKSLRVVTFQKEKDIAGSSLQKIQNDYKRDRDINPDGFFATLPETDTVDCGAIYSCDVDFEMAADNNSVLITATASWLDGDRTLSVSSKQLLQRVIK